MKDIENYIKITQKLIAEKKLTLVISLQNTVCSSSDKNFNYMLPIRYLDNYLFAGICNGNSKETRFFLKELQNLSKYILVDVEKKYPWNESKDIEKMYYGNIDGLVSDIIQKEKLIHIWPNSMTVEACLASLFSEKEPLCNLKVAVIGLGNIGSKVALRLVEAGAQTSIFTRDYDATLKLSNTINKLKPKSTITSPLPFRRFITCAANQNYIFICTGSDLKISIQIANNISENTKLFTLTKIQISKEIQKIFKKKNISIQTIDITSFYLMEVLKYEAFQKFKSQPLRIKYEDNWLVSGGFNGEPKDIVVDNARNPRIYLGVINDKGHFDRKTQTWDDWLKINAEA